MYDQGQESKQDRPPVNKLISPRQLPGSRRRECNPPSRQNKTGIVSFSGANHRRTYMGIGQH